jgi:hypothetical protein
VIAGLGPNICDVGALVITGPSPCHWNFIGEAFVMAGLENLSGLDIGDGWIPPELVPVRGELP